tara:strand:+ start:6636 stop:6881 length:246 start_codon:yes stop_codon:yes gene_type:complete
MNWLEIAAIVVLLMGIGAGGYLVAQRPAFWAGLGAVLIKAVWPHILKYVSARMTPEQEKEFSDCVKRGGEWDSFRKKCRIK